MLKTLALTSLIASFALPAMASLSVQGTWLIQDKTAKVRIAPCGPRLCGTVVWIKDRVDKTTGQPPVDAKNPDPKLRNRPILGLQLLRDFTPAGDNKWTGGAIYDPNVGKTFSSKMTLTPKGELKVEGCVSVICQGQTWSTAD